MRAPGTYVRRAEFYEALTSVGDPESRGRRFGTSGGHYRVAVGYDDLQQVIDFVDPWGRDLRYLPGDYEGLAGWTYDEVAVGWNDVAYGTDKPFWGCVIMPWKVDLRVKGKLEVSAQGVVSGSVPEARWQGQSRVYPPCSYTDAIGGSATLFC